MQLIMTALVYIRANMNCTAPDLVWGQTVSSRLNTFSTSSLRLQNTGETGGYEATILLGSSLGRLDCKNLSPELKQI